LLVGLPRQQAEREIEDSQKALEQMVGARVRHFGYPFGELSNEVREFVSNRFDSACGLEFRLARYGDDIYNLPRIDSLFADDLMRFGGPARLTGRAYIDVRRKMQDWGIDRRVWAFRRLASRFATLDVGRKNGES
jgi:peptidoglycan/xylan/chitin deacetylase (PgdA/CDA1 family)